MVLGGFVGGFGWFWVVPYFSNYDRLIVSILNRAARTMRDGLTFCHLHWQNLTVGSSFRLYYLPGKAFMEIFSLASAFFG